MAGDYLAALTGARILPIVSVGPDAAELIDDLVGAGAAAIEILFRHPDSPAVLAAAKARHTAVAFAAGTILGADQAKAAAVAGADLFISPGLTPELADVCARTGVPLVPGAQTASEVMAARQLGFTLLKFYPAEPNGAVAILRDYANVFPDVRFIPTGGIREDVLPGYAALPNVLAVGGSWLTASLPNDDRRTEVATRFLRSRAVMEGRG